MLWDFEPAELNSAGPTVTPLIEFIMAGLEGKSELSSNFVRGRIWLALTELFVFWHEVQNTGCL
jgi:hypothetical protein